MRVALVERLGTIGLDPDCNWRARRAATWTALYLLSLTASSSMVRPPAMWGNRLLVQNQFKDCDRLTSAYRDKPKDASTGCKRVAEFCNRHWAASFL